MDSRDPNNWVGAAKMFNPDAEVVKVSGILPTSLPSGFGKVGGTGITVQCFQYNAKHHELTIRDRADGDYKEGEIYEDEDVFFMIADDRTFFDFVEKLTVYLDDQITYYNDAAAFIGRRVKTNV